MATELVNLLASSSVNLLVYWWLRWLADTKMRGACMKQVGARIIYA